MTDVRTTLLNEAVASLRDIEHEILDYVTSLDADVVATLPADLAEMAAARHTALDGYLRARDALTDIRRRGEGTLPRGTVTLSGPAAVAVVDLYATLSRAALAYAALFEMSLRLYDPQLREIAPRHLDETANAASLLTGRLAHLVSEELARQGLDCHCVCPMCSLGACGCVSVGHGAATSLSPREDADSAEGFSLQRPREASQLADAGVVAGDRLLAVDDVPVATVLDVQSALRRHAIGERVELLVAHGDSRRRLVVTHVHDY